MLAPLATQALRASYRREILPASVRWTLASAAMRDWIRGVAKALRSDLPDTSRQVVADTVAQLFERRYDVLRESHPGLPDRQNDPRAVAKFMAGLYQLELQPKARWIFDGVGGAPRGVTERFESQRLSFVLSAEERWMESATHLGQLLIVMTELLPAELPKARQRLASICFDMGAAYASRIAKLYGMSSSDNLPANAIEILRMGEYIFRVNPVHTSSTDPVENTGVLEGDSCLWYSLPGWERGHCGIFGQFQAGICSVFGLSYKLDQTIPKHGGDICRVTLHPIRKR
jgi:hypothetical protein